MSDGVACWHQHDAETWLRDDGLAVWAARGATEPWGIGVLSDNADGRPEPICFTILGARYATPAEAIAVADAMDGEGLGDAIAFMRAIVLLTASEPALDVFERHNHRLTVAAHIAAGLKPPPFDFAAAAYREVTRFERKLRALLMERDGQQPEPRQGFAEMLKALGFEG